MTEMVVQQLLLEAGAEGVDPDLVSVDPQGFEVAADWSTLRTPETYVSFGRSAGFASPSARSISTSRTTTPSLHDSASTSGRRSGGGRLRRTPPCWMPRQGRIAFRFQARDVNLVMGPAARGTSVPFRVRLDGAAPGAAHGFDVDEQGSGTLSEQRLYQLIREPGRVGERLVEIEFLEPGAEAYCFTFG